ncbi:efflux RND transporter permease subunit [Lichenifustis flavocetrariae]|uniref:Efflux RND transporter permease subunit n=1 Tax=Lichenifustis flavocetrariae TaxID=2949735 RepID=A0AA41Z257_9HYPH|nr:efflux RND transporter permease subunit [Lichenifustis flavocetrariae]MCW6508965.1 efflux RND transporter permease subunit [Lichenifustis flavocetrariae]
MGLVLYALKYRISFYVISLLVLFGGIGASVVTPKDVLPNVNIPVVVVVWTYNGLNTTDMASRITTYSEFSLSNNVNNIQRMESTTLPGSAIERIYFQQNVSIDLAITQVVSAMNSIRAVMPPGVQPPVVMRFSASSVPVIQLALSSKTSSQAAIYDYAQYRIRQTLTQVPGSTLPSPYGGAPRQIMVDLDLRALQGYGLTPLDVTNAVVSQNIVVPSGLAKIGELQYPIRLNASPQLIDELNQLPVKVVGGTPVLVRDVANVRDGSPPQLNIVRTNGLRSILETILKNGEASTLTVVNNVKSFLPQIRAAAPKGFEITPIGDQSVFVTGAINDVVREALIAAGLTGLMILLFLGSWRSTLVVLASIPLAILFALIVLSVLGETLNIMTLGGLALAVGILVDDATVAIENTYRLMENGKSFRDSVVEGAAGIAKPALISTLAICSAFVSVFFLTDAPKYLFTPQAMAVVFAMLASYFLSRTLVPIMIDVLVKREFDSKYGAEHQEGPQRDRQESPAAIEKPKPGWMRRQWSSIWRHVGKPLRWAGRQALPAFRAVSSWMRWGHGRFEAGFARFQRGYAGLLQATIAHRLATLGVVAAVFALGAGIFVFTGQDYFPQVSGDSMTLHIRTRDGERIETAEQVFARVERVVRETVPKKDLELILDNIGLPSSNYNFAFGDGSFVAYNDGQMIISLKEGHASTLDYMKRLRDVLPQKFPDVMFYFQPSDMITQILDFGTITPIDIQVSGRKTEKDLEVAGEIEAKLRGVRGAVDVHLHQITHAPELFVDVDRKLASEIGLTEQQIAQSMNVSLSGSYQVQPNFWADPKTGIPYQLWVQTPEWRNDSLQALSDTPIFRTSLNTMDPIGTTSVPGASSGGAQAADQPGVLTLLSTVATMRRDSQPTVISHVNTQNTLDIFASAQDRDLGGISKDIDRIVADAQKKLPAPDKITVRGQIESMHSAFGRIELGLAIAMVVVYMLMAVNFQSWGDPLVVILALPIAFCGILTSLFVTHTSLSIPSLFGAIMSVGVASSNSILLVTFAREHREETGCNAVEAAIAAGETRLRPVLMTAGAMFVGLLPMAIGIGEGSEQNAALARAVLGGVAFGTCSTLLFVPFLYATLRQGRFKGVEDYR